MKKQRIFYFDFIRTISVIFIIIFHFNCSIGAHSIYMGNKPIIFYSYVNGNLGQIGVSLFFILSGASLMYTYKDKFTIGEFTKKRLISLYPMFYIAYICVFLFYFYKYFSLNPFGVAREKWSFILTIFGIDGYLSGIIPDYYILGEWFLGGIILMYVLFPLLRKLILNTKPIISIILLLLEYILVVQLYNINFPIEYCILTRLLEFAFGMYLIKYCEKIKMYQVLISLAILLLLICKYIEINQMYKVTIMGISLFVVLSFIGQHISYKFSKPFECISKYSYAIFLIHHVIIEQICSRFDGHNLRILEAYCLLIIILILIAFFSFILYKTNSILLRKTTDFIKQM
ncbi:acyltransferase [Clostridium sp. ZS6]|uniref:acyltransferase family protein n=1 Tax=Clostridium sp. ZS6 TaxID=2949987 RepID=UPI002079A449|nr:acyltransferase [Clostridium sp. ZS6]